MQLILCLLVQLHPIQQMPSHRYASKVPAQSSSVILLRPRYIPQHSFRILLNPLPRDLIELLAIILILIRQRRLNSIVDVRLDQNISYHNQNSRDPVRWLPLVAP